METSKQTINIPLCFRILLLLLLSHIAASSTIVTSLPGFNGTLPFSLETGYVGVGDMDDVQLFYYFVESQRNPAQDPLMLWLTGGPGCSCLSAFFYESGPVYFEFEGYKGGLPTLRLNEYTWTQRANILYVDAPVGTGFSYSESQEGYCVDDYKSAKQTYEFLRKWLKSHPEFLENNLYIGGDSYSGIILPMVVQEIIDGNELGRQPYMNLKGYILGNPVTDSYVDDNSRIPFAHRLTLISDDLYRGYILGNPVTDSYVDDNSRIPFAHRLTLISEDLYRAAKASCNGDYVNIDNEDCELNMEAIDELILDINLVQVLEPYCGDASPRPHERKWRQRSLKEHPKDPLRLQPIGPAYFCRDYLYVLSEIWANNETVQEALNVRSGTVGVWQRCNGSLVYTKDVTSTIAYHQNLTAASLRTLIYSGDHDMLVPHIGTEQWINTLNLTLSNVWRAWFVDAQVAGYVRRFTKDNYALTYATVKGAGNLAPEYKQKECYTMIDRWFAYYPL